MPDDEHIDDNLPTFVQIHAKHGTAYLNPAMVAMVSPGINAATIVFGTGVAIEIPGAGADAIANAVGYLPTDPPEPPRPPLILKPA